MKTIMKLGWRNLWRNKRRSLVVISSITIGIFFMIFSMAFMNGMNIQMIENTIKTYLGHIAIHKKGFHEFMKLEYNYGPNSSIMKAIESNQEVKAYTPRVKIQGMIRSSEASRGIMIVGIDPDKEKGVSSIFDYTIKDDQSSFLTAEDENSILISKSLAKKLDLMLGDRVVLMFQDINNEIKGIGLTVNGFFVTPIDSFDKYVVFTTIRRLQKETGIGENISELNIILNDSRNVESTKKNLISKIDDNNLEILTWKDMAPNLVSAVQLFDNMMYMFFVIIFITVIFSIVNTLIMAIMERFHEIGVMKAIGTSPKWIFSIVMFEALNLGIVGLIVGIGGGIAITELLAITGVDFSFYVESMRMWGTGMIIYPMIKTLDIVVATAIVIFTTMIAALYPAFKAARIKALEALHYV